MPRFFHGPLSETRREGNHNWTQVRVMIAGGRVQGIRSLSILERTLHDKLVSAALPFNPLRSGDEHDYSQLEVGDTDWDRGQIRLFWDIDVQLDYDDLKKALADAGFEKGLPPAIGR